MAKQDRDLSADPVVMELAARLAFLQARLQELEDEGGDSWQEDILGRLPKELGDGDYPDSLACVEPGHENGHVASLGFNPDTGPHLGELGMWASWETWGAGVGKTIPKIPYLAKDYADEGALAWVPPDADSTGYGEGTTRSLQILSGILQLYGFAAAGETQIPQKMSGILTWVYPSTLSVGYASEAQHAEWANWAYYLDFANDHAYHDLFSDTAASAAHDTHNDARYAPKGVDGAGFCLMDMATGELHPITITKGSITAIG